MILIVLNYTVIPQFNTLYEAMGTHKSNLMTILTFMLNVLPKIVLVIISIAMIFLMYISIILRSNNIELKQSHLLKLPIISTCLLYTSDAADDTASV